MMDEKKLSDDERANNDLLEFYFQERVPVHIFLKKLTQDGKSCWLNGLIIRKATDRVWILQERKLGEVRIAISEISAFGVKKFEEKEVE